MNETTERWWPMKEITEHLGVSRYAVRSRIEKYNIPARRIGRLWIFRISDVDVWNPDVLLQSNTEETI